MESSLWRKELNYSHPQKLEATEGKAKEKSTNPSNAIPIERISQTDSQRLCLPRRNKNNYRVIAYLLNRGIDRDIIMDCINRGLLYESAIYHAAVFVGKDENGQIRFATIRGTMGDFKRDAEGSSKKYGFVLPPDNPASCELALFESAIDCLSHKSLCRQGHLPNYDGWRLSLGGACTNALIHFLHQHPNINRCHICTDDDATGNIISERITQEIPAKMTSKKEKR